MNPALDESLLADLSQRVGEHLGLSFPPSRWHDLERAFCRAATELGFQDRQQCIRWFLTAPVSRELIESIATFLTTGETYFLREGRSFDILEQEIVPEIFRAHAESEQRLRFWSAGCATGEEPYSLAIMLHRMGVPLRGWDISILATDINPLALRKARDGVYSEWSFRDTPAWLKESYFTRREGGRFELIPAIKKMVTFSYLNLAEAPCPSLLTGTNGMDVIFCRNVLMYFTPEQAARAVERFRLSLVEGGWLVAGSCETSNVLFAGFKSVNFSGMTLYRRQMDSAPTTKERDSQTFSLPPRAPVPVRTRPQPSPAPQVPLSKPPPPPERPPFSYDEALALYEQGACHEAAERVTIHLAHHHNDTGALTLLCRIRANEGRLDEALHLAEQALATDKLNPGLHYLRAMILQEQGVVDEAAASLRRALYLDHDLVLAHFTLGNIAQRQGKHPESRKHFGRALAILTRYRPEEVLPESEGMPAGKLTELIRATAAGME